MLLSNFIHKTEQLQNSSISQPSGRRSRACHSQRLGFLLGSCPSASLCTNVGKNLKRAAPECLRPSLAQIFSPATHPPAHRSFSDSSDGIHFSAIANTSSFSVQDLLGHGELKDNLNCDNADRPIRPKS